MVFCSKLFISFLSKERIMAQKYSRKIGNFWSTCPKASIKVISEYHNLRDLCVWSLKGFWQAWSCSKSWCIPNYQLSDSFKNSSFFVSWFSKNSREFANQKSYGQLPEKAWSNGLFDFFKIVPLGAPRFSKDFKVEESVYWDGFITNSNHQFF